MRRLIAAALLMTLAHPAHAASPPDGKSRAAQILAAIDDLWRGKSSYGKFRMTVVTEHYTRSMLMEGWSRGKEETLVRIIEPKKERGTATLKSGTDIYTYLPRTDRTIRLTAGMMGGAWMGSHLTNDDLVKESRLTDDYDAEVTSEGAREGAQVVVFSLVPKPDAAVVWGRIELTARWLPGKGYYVPVSQVFYDELGELSRRIDYADLKEFDGRMIPAVMRVIPADKPDESTEFIYESLSFHPRIDEGLFSLASLQRMP